MVRFKGLGANAVLSEIPLTLIFLHDLTGPWSFGLIPNGPLGPGPPWPTSPTTAQLQPHPPAFPTHQPLPLEALAGAGSTSPKTSLFHSA